MNDTSFLPPEISGSLLATMREAVWFHTALVMSIINDRPHHCGTATCVAIDGSCYLLTAAHVWREVRGGRFTLSLDEDRRLLPIEMQTVKATLVRGDIEEWGPDLALIRLPEILASYIRTRKSFYNITKRRPSPSERVPYDGNLWAVIGAPAEQSEIQATEATMKITLWASVVAAVHQRDGFDYVDLSYFHRERPDLPSSFGGLSGAGLWYLPVSKTTDGKITWNEEVRLEGVAFFQKPTDVQEGVIRCHGRRSLYERLLEALDGEKPKS